PGTLLLSKGEVVERTLALTGGNKRANLAHFVERLADGERGRAAGKAFGKLFIDRTLHQDAGTGAAVLTAVAEDGVNRGFDAAFHVCILEDHVGRLAAQFKRYARDVVGTQAHDGRANLG